MNDQIIDAVVQAKHDKKEHIRYAAGAFAIAGLQFLGVLALGRMLDFGFDVYTGSAAAALMISAAGMFILVKAAAEYSVAQRTVSGMLKKIITPQAMQPELEDVQLENPKDADFRQLFRSMNMPSHDIVRMGMAVSGGYNDKKFTMTDLELVEIVEVVTEEKDEKTGKVNRTVTHENVTVFDGQLFSMDKFPRTPKEPVFISSRIGQYTDSTLTRLLSGSLATESLEFNRRFSVKCKSGQEMFCVLTPALIDRMNRIRPKGSIRMLTDTDGKVYLAVNSGNWLERAFQGQMPETEEQIAEFRKQVRDHFLRIYEVFAQIAPDGA